MKKNPYTPKLSNELNPGQVKDIGPANFYRIEAKRAISATELNSIRKWLNDNVSSPFSVTKGYGNHNFIKTGTNSLTYIFFFSSVEDSFMFKMKYMDISNA